MGPSSGTGHSLWFFRWQDLPWLALENKLKPYFEQKPTRLIIHQDQETMC